MRYLVISFLILLAACSGHDLATPDGKVFAFNPGQWTPASADLTLPDRVRK